MKTKIMYGKYLYEKEQTQTEYLETLKANYKIMLVVIFFTFAFLIITLLWTFQQIQ